MTGQKFTEKKEPRGFTLIEVLVSLVILSVGILALLLMQAQSIKANYVSRDLQAATILCEDLLERFRAIDSSSPLITAGTHDNSELGVANPIDESGNAGGIYSRTWQVTDDSPVQDAKTIVVTVTWTKKSISHSVQMDMVKFEEP
ncbi:MAG: prepilin-type N-terminal cleavage/methylation domain-containing protein [Deltaproteobacteria bacterium]|nr:MAG: prepilin-type N-terminal cleavage/methylation domain-containing protein [Deltaproteobacteria bacterium]